MGWNSANQIFDPVARALIEANASDDTKRDVLGKLIGQLQDNDWDTEDESLEDFLDDPAIVQAFAARDVHLHDRRCCRVEHKGDPRRALLAMRSEDVSEAEMARGIDAFTHQLAEQIRNADYPAHATDGADYAADLIDPEVKQ
ncbi:hypothetical protein ACWEQ7_04175 [Streptomyces sp. NPDC004069]